MGHTLYSIWRVHGKLECKHLPVPVVGGLSIIVDYLPNNNNNNNNYNYNDNK
jgi:hypothetical protein